MHRVLLLRILRTGYIGNMVTARELSKSKSGKLHTSKGRKLRTSKSGKLRMIIKPILTALAVAFAD